MNKKVIQTDAAPKAIGPYSQAILADGWLFISGQAALDPATGQAVEGDIVAQTERTMANLEAILAAAGMTFDNVVSSTVYLKDMNDFARFNEIYASCLTDAPPARATVEVARLPKDFAVEIAMLARA